MAGTSRQTHGALSTAEPCGPDAGAHISDAAPGEPAAWRGGDGTAATRRNIRTARRRGTAWGGDQDDPRLFYFRTLLASGWFFGGGKRA
ncbi:MAG: hypothetical protein ACK4NP_00210 [Parvularculaceae bacterium]